MLTRRRLFAALLAFTLAQHAGAGLVSISGSRGTSAAAAAQVPQWDNTPVLSGTQSALHALEVDVPFSIDLRDHMTVPGTSFSIVGTSRADDESILPAGISLASNGVLSGTPTEEATVVLKIRAHLGSRDPDASWAARSAGAYVVQRFDADDPIQLGLDTGRALRVSYDTSRKRSGGGSMLMVDGGGTNQQARWHFPLRLQQDYNGEVNGGFEGTYWDGDSFEPSPGDPGSNGNLGFAPGEQFCWQFAIYTDRDFVQHAWPVGAGVGSYSTSGKIAIIDGFPWAPNLNHAPTANNWENVLTPRRGGLMGYTMGNGGCDWNCSISGLPQADFLNAQGNIVPQSAIQDTARSLNGVNVGLPSGGTTGGSWTSDQQQRARNGFVREIYESNSWPDGLPDPLTAGQTFAIDAWQTIQFRHKLAGLPIDQDNSDPARNYFTGGGEMEVWVAQDGQDFVRVYLNDNQWLRIGDHWDGGAATNWFQRASDPNNSPAGSMSTTYQAVSLTTLMFDVPLSGHPTYQQNIDELISAEECPPAPDFDGTGNYRTADVLVTLKVGPNTGGSVLETLAAGMSPGDWLDVTANVNFDEAHVLPNVQGDGSSPTTEFTDRLIYDATNGLVHLFGCARGSPVPPPETAYECGNGAGNDAGYSYYDIADNSWTRDTSHPVYTAPHTYNHATINPANGTFYFWESIAKTGTPSAVQVRAGLPGTSWTTIAQGGGPLSENGALEFFPERNSLVFIDGGNDSNRPAGGSTFYPKIIERSFSGGSWTATTITATEAGMIGYISNFSRYSPQRQLIYFGGGQSVNSGIGGRILWTYDAAGTLERQEDAPSGLPMGTLGASGKQAINPANGNLLVLDNTPKDVWEFDPTDTSDGTWTNVDTHPLSTTGSDELRAVVATIDDLCVLMVVNSVNAEVYLYKPEGCSP